LSLAAAEAFSKVITFAAFVYLARSLGPTNYGYLEFATAVLMCASLIVDQGFSAFGAREIAKRPSDTGQLANEIITSRFLLAASGYLMIAVFSLVINRGPVVTRLLLTYGLSLWALPFLLQWIFQGHERMHLVAIAQLVRQVVFVVTVFFFVRGAEQVQMVAWAEVISVTAAALFCAVIYLRFFKRIPLRPIISARVFREGVPIGVSQMFWVVKMFGGTLLLGLIASSSDVAFFGSAQRILVALHAFVWLYFFNLLPTLSRAWPENDGAFQRTIQKSMHGMVWVALGVGFAWAALAREGVRVVYGPVFQPTGTVLMFFAAVWAMALISGHYRFGLIAAGYATTEMKTSALGATLALICIPVGYLNAGINGAAIGLVIAEAGIWLSSWLCARNLLSLKGNSNYLHRPLIAIAVLLLVMWLLPSGTQSIRLAIAVLLPALLALALEQTARLRVIQLFRPGRI